MSKWLFFSEPHTVLKADKSDDVFPILNDLESFRQKGYYYTGFLSYEAAAGFDPALETRDPGKFPLCWFGIFKDPDFFPDYSLKQPFQPAVANWIADCSSETFAHQIKRIKDYLLAGDTYQVNYTFRLKTKTSLNPWSFFLTMQHNNQCRYGALLFTGQVTLCSASPELFFEKQGERIFSRPMKGTRQRGRTQEEDSRIMQDLEQSAKDRAENVMIVDMIRNDMGQFARAGSVTVDHLFDIEKYPTVWQMVSRVSCRTQAPLPEILKALFPCASITGAPKARTMSIIRELEFSPRKVYTGSIGFVTPQNRAQFNVAIRSAILDHRTDTGEYGVGCGIVWDSNPESEYQEALDKAAILHSVRPDFKILETLLWTRSEGVFLAEYHKLRMAGSAEYFDYPFEADSFEKILQKRTKNLTADAHKIRILLDRNGKISLEIHDLATNTPDSPLRLRRALTPVDPSDPFLYHKTTHRRVYETAKQSVPDCDDVLLWNTNHEITETSIANVVFELDRRYVTPPVQSGLLDGTYRRFLLDAGTIEERVIPLADLNPGTPVYCINSVSKWRKAVLL